MTYWRVWGRGRRAYKWLWACLDSACLVFYEHHLCFLYDCVYNLVLTASVMLHLVATSFLIGQFSMNAFLAFYISNDSLAFCQLLLVSNEDLLDWARCHEISQSLQLSPVLLRTGPVYSESVGCGFSPSYAHIACLIILFLFISRTPMVC